MTFNIITIFPEIFNSYFNESILGRAQKNKLIKIKVHDLRKWTNDKHKTVDDSPYGGGAGMVMKVEPIYNAINCIKKQETRNKKQTNSKSQISNSKTISNIQYPISKTILLSAKGRNWNQQLARKYARLDNIIFICGRYEGVDERVKKLVDDEISIGDYVLTGGEIPAMTIIDSITRLLPGVLGNEKSAKDESHSAKNVLEYPQYTRPAEFKINNKKCKVPKILLSGNHAEIEKWRKEKQKTKK
ncbi:MAG: tRNA (guanosine(37)-N1)-methyltransferase TrmD [Candidatus Falkowbacteria bacterium]